MSVRNCQSLYTKQTDTITPAWYIFCYSVCKYMRSVDDAYVCKRMLANILECAHKSKYRKSIAYSFRKILEIFSCKFRSTSFGSSTSSISIVQKFSKYCLKITYKIVNLWLYMHYPILLKFNPKPIGCIQATIDPISIVLNDIGVTSNSFFLCHFVLS